MNTLAYLGETANLRLLEEEIREDPRLADHCTVTLTKKTDGAASLHHGQIVEIAISIAAGVATNGIYDLVRTLVNRARDRGPIEPVEPTNPNDEEQEQEG
ncbi:hypothetical protein [Embleya sp. NPDC020886]|uniref:hypothetical protein n=1 Tax=Embleya sp. NPDC020886 TaxID=3363980 RepID=UPI0037B2143C